MTEDPSTISCFTQFDIRGTVTPLMEKLYSRIMWESGTRENLQSTVFYFLGVLFTLKIESTPMQFDVFDTTKLFFNFSSRT